MRAIRLVLGLALISPFALGCSLLGGVGPAIPTIVSVVNDAMLILKTIDAAAQEYFRSREVPEDVRKEYVRAYTAAVAALNAANHTLRGVKNIDQKEYDRAIQEFRSAYGGLRDFLEQYGVMRDDKMSIGGDEVTVPVPEAIEFRFDD
jgi:hypothetical protein